MGALPNKLAGFQDIGDDQARGKFEAEWSASVPAEPGLHMSLIFEAMELGEIKSLFVLGENPAQSEADGERTRRARRRWWRFRTCRCALHC